MASCPGVGQQGRLHFIDGFEDWHVIRPVCEVRWIGGGPVIVEHEDRRPRPLRSGEGA